MMGHRYKSLAAVFAIILDDDKVLLQKRLNTGYKDGYYDVAASGHLEANESLLMAMQRELSEELGIHVEKKYIDMYTLVHKNDVETGLIYLNVYFLVHQFEGVPQINEPEKNAELRWYPLNELPNNIINDRKIVLNGLTQNNMTQYLELGWQNNERQ